ncbi:MULTISPECIES: hypothetical protein [Lachnospiraceae]|uniref:Uncharacterized protein n=1 Tax=Faecalicatena acetigenes TaxID=2981790 RepID=A0ABT2T7R1_9FIRM|nr:MULTISPECIES: hypothetical protein [Lachnospiraceae]MCU6746270.1 hypothetical protein [Faecalicatena acetigenes]
MVKVIPGSAGLHSYTAAVYGHSADMQTADTYCKTNEKTGILQKK